MSYPFSFQDPSDYDPEKYHPMKTKNPMYRAERLFAALINLTGAGSKQEAIQLLAVTNTSNQEGAKEASDALKVLIEEWPGPSDAIKPGEFLPIEDSQVISIQELCHAVNDWAQKKGWNETPDSIDHKLAELMLVNTELAECAEYLRVKPDAKCPKCSRDGEFLHGNYYCATNGCAWQDFKFEVNQAMDDKVPSLTGEAAELADAMIRILHYCGRRGINLGEAIQLKHQFNITRPYRHGKTV